MASGTARRGGINMAIDEEERAKLMRLAEQFREFAAQTFDPEFRARFLRTAEELERRSRRES
jgi:coenzyme F420-reducing hydrogenase alpha subunit